MRNKKVVYSVILNIEYCCDACTLDDTQCGADESETHLDYLLALHMR